MPRVLKLRMERDLLWINVLGIILIVAISLIPESFVRILIGVPFILFFPGYTLVRALFPGKKELDGVERLGLSIGLSIAVVPLLGLLLNYTPFGIRLHPVLVSLFGFTFLMSIASEYRKRRLVVEERFVPSFSINVPRWGELNGVDKTLSVGFVAGLVVSGALLSSFIATPRVGERFTQFYVLGPDGKAEGYPTNLTVGEEGKVILGVANQEHEEVNYNIVVKLDNLTVGTIENVQLMHEERWEENYTFTTEETGDKVKLEFLLFKEGLIEAYRSLNLWISVKPQE